MSQSIGLESHDHLTFELNAKPIIFTADNSKKAFTGALAPFDIPGHLSHSTDYCDMERHPCCDNCNSSTGISSWKIEQIVEGRCSRKQKSNKVLVRYPVRVKVKDIMF